MRLPGTLGEEEMAIMVEPIQVSRGGVVRNEAKAGVSLVYLHGRFDLRLRLGVCLPVAQTKRHFLVNTGTFPIVGLNEI